MNYLQVSLPPGTDLTDFPLGKKTIGKRKITISLNYGKFQVPL